MKTLVSLLLVISFGFNLSVFGQTTTDDRADKARQAATKIGTGQKAKVEVKLRDKTGVKGYIGAISQDKLSLVDEKTGATRDIAFLDIDKLKKRGGFGTGSWIAVGVLAGAAVIVTSIVLIRCRNELGCGAGR